MKKTLILNTPFLFYRRKDKIWPAKTIAFALLGFVALAFILVRHEWGMLLYLPMILLLELPGWFDKPYCLVREDSITVKWGWHTYRSFRIEELQAIGRYEENGAQPMLFLSTVRPKTIRQFSQKHLQEQAVIAKHYGYDPAALTEEALQRVMLTLYLWKKAKRSNPNTAVICLTKGAWSKLDSFRETHPLPYVILSAPEGGCSDEL